MGKHKKRTRLFVAVLVSGALLAAACGDDDDTSSTATTAGVSGGAGSTAAPGTSAAPSDGTGAGNVGAGMSETEASDAVVDLMGPLESPEGNTTRGIDGTTITIAGVGTIKNQAGNELYPGMCEGAHARFERANREGGVNGYTIDFKGCTDDGLDPARQRQALQDAVESDGAFAIVPFTSPVSEGGYLNEEHVPYIGFGIGAAYCGWSDQAFGFSMSSAEGCLTGLPDNQSMFSSLALTGYLKASGRDAADVKLALIGTGDPINSASVHAFEVIAEDLGIEVAYAETPCPPATAPPLTDYTPIATAVTSSGADFTMVICGDTAGIAALIGTLKATGYKGDTMQFSYADARLFAVPALVQAVDSSYTLLPQAGSDVFDSPTFDQITDDLAAINESDVSPAALGTMWGYGSADLFLAGLAEVEGDLTAEAFAAAMNDGFEYPGIESAVCPSTWPAAHVMASNCSAIVKVDAAAKTFAPALDMGVHGSLYLVKI